MFPFVDSLLVKYGEFFPVAAALTAEGRIATVATYDGNDRPLSDDVIRDLKKALKLGAEKGTYVAAVIFYDVWVVNPFDDKKTDAVVVHFENVWEAGAKRFYCPYILSKDSTLTYSQGWSNDGVKEIFK